MAAGLALALGAGPVGIFALGVALLVSAVALRSDDELPATLEADPRTGSVTLRSIGGGSATLPRRAIERVHVVEQAISSSSVHDAGASRQPPAKKYLVTLLKADAGTIELASFGDQERASSLAAEIDRVIRRAPASADADPSAVDPLKRLRDCTEVKLERGEPPRAGYRSKSEEERFCVSWRAGARPRHLLSVAMLIAGAIVVFLGIVQAGAPRGLLVMPALFGLGGLAFVVSTLLNLGVTVAIHVDDSELAIERRRGARTLHRKVLPLAAIRAIDASYQVDLRGGQQLRIRLDEAQQIQLAVAASRDPKAAYRAMGGVGAALRAAWTLDRNTITVPIARLPFADQMNLDLALSEEVSRRTGGAEV